MVRFTWTGNRFIPCCPPASLLSVEADPYSLSKKRIFSLRFAESDSSGVLRKIFPRKKTIGSREKQTPPTLKVSQTEREDLSPSSPSVMADNPVRKPRKLTVYLYIPNIIGYIRILMNCVAFAICFSNKRLFSLLYFVSFVCDGIDGWCARKFNQVSTFGAILDMVTDRISTACLLVILSQVYRPGLTFLLLLALDIASHWLQMYSTFLSGKVSHKDVKDSTNWLFRAYYGNRMFMAFCCVACEALYITLFLRAEKTTEKLSDVLARSSRGSPFLLLLLALSIFGWTIKQAVNVIQMKTAADVCVLHDITKKRAP